ncbi:MAG: TetR/AcrR family transcriptional regulator [Rhizobiales bacterium]|nr:TetR/AcrR family transcriptional regulator [Hyphomicrobiales bacterium]
MSSRKNSGNVNAMPPQRVDGRHMRSERSRERIVDALTELTGEGNMEPSQAEVAERANVSLRTVSRHFEDMETLYAQCTQKIETTMLNKFMAPFESTDWYGRIFELLERRMAAFEQFLPYRVFSSVRRFRSDFVAYSYARVLGAEVAGAMAVLPPELKNDKIWASAFDSAMSFESWRRMRHDRKLTIEEASAVFYTHIEALLAAKGIASNPKRSPRKP